jgi:hypothetical protein
MMLMMAENGRKRTIPIGQEEKGRDLVPFITLIADAEPTITGFGHNLVRVKGKGGIGYGEA